MLFASLREPPPKGSPRESILLLYVLKREQIEHARLRALAQAIVSKDKGPEAFDAYLKMALPWLTQQKNREKEDHVRVLMEEVKKGGLRIKAPLWQEATMRSRLRMRVVERQEPIVRSKSREEMNVLYTKLGKSIPV